MVELTSEQRTFLRQHEISAMSVFDASGMRKDEYRHAMKAEEKFFAVGVTPCKKGGHTLRDRSGHCIQCDTSNIAFTRRYYKEGYVYVFSSTTLKMLKVGFSNDTSDRERTVNGFAYGGARDWGMIAHVRCENGGRVEFAVHQLLEPYLAPQHYFANGHQTTCREIFACGYTIVRDAVISALGVQNAVLREVPNAIERFSFPTRRSAPSQ